MILGLGSVYFRLDSLGKTSGEEVALRERCDCGLKDTLILLPLSPSSLLPEEEGP